jgi:DNA-binding HxlR family transcriptional regulator
VRGKRTDLGDTACAASRALAVVGDWWSLLIVRDALLGVSRFSDFQHNIGLAKNILSSRLKKLVEGGVLRIEPDGPSGKRHHYLLTEQGLALGVVVTALWQWGETHCFQANDQAPLLVDRATGQPLARLELRTIDGRAVSPKELQMGLVERPTKPEV